MKQWTCKCGYRWAVGSDIPSPCTRCPKCKTTLLRNADGTYRPVTDHVFKTMYDQRTGEPYQICDRCYQRKTELERRGEL
jgi:hypothetical protein